MLHQVYQKLVNENKLQMPIVMKKNFNGNIMVQVQKSGETVKNGRNRENPTFFYKNRKDRRTTQASY